MDAESLVQIERVVSTAVGGAEGRLRKEIEALGTSLRQEFGEKTEALGTSLRQEIGEKTEALGTSLRQEIGEKTEALGSSLRQEFGEKTEALGASLRQEFAEKTEKLGERIEEVRQYSGVLYEDMSRKLDLVLEGFEGLRQGQTALRQMIEHESLELQSLIKLSYRQLQDRVETLEQRVQIIEKRLGLSN